MKESIFHNHFGKSAPLRRFAVLWFLFALPFLIVIGVVEWSLWKTGETVPIPTVVAMQRESQRKGEQPVVWLRAGFDQNENAYKQHAFPLLKPRIIALGSSRAMKFRAEMFGRDGKDFFNCGGIVRNIDDLENFVENLSPDNTPEVVMFGVDHWWLNANCPPDYQLTYDAVTDWRAHVQVWRMLLRRSKRKRPALRKQLIEVLRSPDPKIIGVRAHYTSRFHPDGSCLLKSTLVPQNEAQWRAHWSQEGQRWLERLRTGGSKCQFTTGVSKPRLERLRAALKKLQSKGALILLFAPPLDSRSAALIEKIPLQRGLWREYLAALPQIALEMNIPYCDASSPPKLGLNDFYMFDANHAEETYHLHILREWLKNPQARRVLPDASRVVEAALKSPLTNYWHPDLGENTIPRPTEISEFSPRKNTASQLGGQSNSRPSKT